MAYEIAGYAVRITLVAGADLSALQYYFVKLNGSGQAVACAAATDQPIGVLQNTPISGAEATVVVVGGTKLVVNGAIAVAKPLGTNATGKGDIKIPGTDTTEYTVGVAVTASTADADLITAIVNCASPTRAA